MIVRQMKTIAVACTVGCALLCSVAGAVTSAETFAQNATNPNFVPNWSAIARRIAEEKDATTQWYLALAVALALALKWLVDLLVHLGDPRDGVRQALPWLLAVLGVAVGALDAYLSGARWTDAAILGAAAPGAVVVNELGNALRRALQKPTAAPDAPKN
jgi:hypothetical protein